MIDRTKDTNVCYCGAYGGGVHTKSARCVEARTSNADNVVKLANQEELAKARATISAVLVPDLAAEIIARAFMRLQCADVPREPWHWEVCQILQTPQVPDETKADPLDAWRDMASAPKDGTRILALVTQKQFYPNTLTPDELIPAVVRWTGEYSEWSMMGIGGLRPTLWQPIVLSEKASAPLTTEQKLHRLAVSKGDHFPDNETLKRQILSDPDD